MFAKSSTVTQRTITYSGLGKFGRFGNQVFQYAFLRSLARVSGARYECAPWIGQKLFGLNDPPVSEHLPPLVESGSEASHWFDVFDEASRYVEYVSGMHARRVYPTALRDGTESGDLVGYFHCHTRHYAPHKDFIRSIFRPAPYLTRWLDEPLRLLRERGRTVIALHLRDGDYRWLPQLPYTLVTAPEWWVEWLDGHWSSFENPVLYVCSDSLDNVVDAFSKYNPVTPRDLCEPPPAELRGVNVDYYRDFHVLSQADVTCISNSSFSFFAAMLNERAQRFVRPTWNASERFIDFDPWNSLPKLHSENRKGSRPLGSILATAYERAGIAEVLKTVFAYLPAGITSIARLRVPMAYKVDGVTGVLRALMG